MSSYKQRWEQYFNLLDADGSGFIHPDDVSGYMEVIP